MTIFHHNVITDEPIEFENNWLKFKTLKKLSIILEEFTEDTPNQ
jgi:hypothetical protein